MHYRKNILPLIPVKILLLALNKFIPSFTLVSEAVLQVLFPESLLLYFPGCHSVMSHFKTCTFPGCFEFGEESQVSQ